MIEVKSAPLTMEASFWRI